MEENWGDRKDKESTKAEAGRKYTIWLPSKRSHHPYVMASLSVEMHELGVLLHPHITREDDELLDGTEGILKRRTKSQKCLKEFMGKRIYMANVRKEKRKKIIITPIQ